MHEFLKNINSFLWNVPMLVYLGGIHIFFTLKLKFVQKYVFKAIKNSFSGGSDGSKKNIFSSLSTTLAATLGTGNIIGIASAISLGGPGAVIWCMFTGIFGMATSYAECFLSVKYRKKMKDGSYLGGPFLIFERGLNSKKIGRIIAFLLIISAFCVGCSTQSNAIASSAKMLFGLPVWLSGGICAVFTGFIILKGAKSLMDFCSRLVPVMAIVYIFLCIIILIINIRVIPKTIFVILVGAFSPKAVFGGILGGSIGLAARYGLARGLFTNEAGLGTAPISFSCSDETELSASPVSESSNIDYVTESSLTAMTSVFWDTIVMCTMTGLVIISSLIAHPGIEKGFSGSDLTMAAFTLLPFGDFFLGISLILFAQATLAGWSYFGRSAVIYLFGKESVKCYNICYCFMIFIGAVLSLSLIWELTDFVNVLMLIPNTLALLILRSKIHTPNFK